MFVHGYPDVWGLGKMPSQVDEHFFLWKMEIETNRLYDRYIGHLFEDKLSNGPGYVYVYSYVLIRLGRFDWYCDNRQYRHQLFSYKLDSCAFFAILSTEVPGIKQTCILPYLPWIVMIFSRWWFQIFFIFNPTWGNDPI